MEIYVHDHLSRNSKFCCSSDSFKNSNAVIVGLPFDNTASFRPGARFGPVRISEQELISFTGEPIDISFNIRYLQDFINSMTGEVLWFGCNDAVMPAAFRDLADNSLQYIVMPFKPKNNY